MANFIVLKTTGAARAGELITPHGLIPTPVLCPVGTQASIKALSPDDVRDIGMRMILSNTYHLYLRPGIPVIEKLGGLHRFMGWDGAILTDSGGYQVFSLSRLSRITDAGVTFRSHIDGGQHTITPELAIRYQESLGSDIAMVLDECVAHDAGREKVWSAMVRTNHWAERCLTARSRSDQAVYGIVQGGVFSDIREESTRFLTRLPFDGYAIGGLSIGESKAITFDITHRTAALLPIDKPRYLMGVGAPEDVLECVGRGIDIFDCALPTRVARNGGLYTRQGRVDILNSAFHDMPEPVDPDCDCYTCRRFSAAYLHHLFASRELLAYRLATIHNLTFMHRLMTDTRNAVLDGTFEAFKAGFLSGYRTTDEAVRLNQKQKWLRAQEARGEEEDMGR